MSNNKFILDEFLPYQLAVAATRVSQEFSKSYQKSHGINRADWRIICHLSQLGDGEAISVRDLEERVHLEKSKVSRSVSRLEERGIVEKKHRVSNARLLDIKLTDKGRAVFLELVPLANAYQNKLMQRLRPDERQQLSVLLEKLSPI